MNIEQQAVSRMFDQISPTYDRANRLLSFGQDIRWRKKLSETAPFECKNILDVATGTADLLLTLISDRPESVGVGVDLSKKMLALGQNKVSKLDLDHRVKLQVADASSLPFADRSFDLITIAFGIRNVEKSEAALKEMVRVLKPGGQALILEFSLPKNPLIKWPYLLYFRHVLPFLGGVISKQPQAYRYLNQTVEAFPAVLDFSNRLQDCGFSEVSAHALTFGVAHIYCARKS
jgi:demethylmenaquinone methyltransferase/2-methoxy-6-polyprenyl-1,4-benzoquinol methylase